MQNGAWLALRGDIRAKRMAPVGAGAGGRAGGGCVPGKSCPGGGTPGGGGLVSGGSADEAPTESPPPQPTIAMLLTVTVIRRRNARLSRLVMYWSVAPSGRRSESLSRRWRYPCPGGQFTAMQLGTCADYPETRVAAD